MPNTTERVEIITGRERRRRYSAEHKLALVEETMLPGMTVSAVARIHGLVRFAAQSPSLLFNWRRLMIQGGEMAVKADEDVIAVSRARELEQRVRELERLLGRKTLEVEVLKEAFGRRTGEKTALAVAVAAIGRFPVKVVADTLGVARSNHTSRSADRRSAEAAISARATTS